MHIGKLAWILEDDKDDFAYFCLLPGLSEKVFDYPKEIARRLSEKWFTFPDWIARPL